MRKFFSAHVIILVLLVVPGVLRASQTEPSKAFPLLESRTRPLQSVTDSTLHRLLEGFRAEHGFVPRSDQALYVEGEAQAGQVVVVPLDDGNERSALYLYYLPDTSEFMMLRLQQSGPEESTLRIWGAGSDEIVANQGKLAYLPQGDARTPRLSEKTLRGAGIAPKRSVGDIISCVAKTLGIDTLDVSSIKSFLASLSCSALKTFSTIQTLANCLSFPHPVGVGACIAGFAQLLSCGYVNCSQGGGQCDQTPGDWGYCADSDCAPCGQGEGDCDDDSECRSGLVCSQNVGASYGFASGVDVCEAPSGGSGGCALPNGDFAFCEDCGPCDSGQGDCDSDSECKSGLTCVYNVGANYGFASGVDVCEAPSGPNGCALPNGDFAFCEDCGPCDAGQGDCDSDSECKSGLTCVANVGANYGFPSSVDVCEAPSGGNSCGLPNGDYDFCRDCGPCGRGQGDCDDSSECKPGLTCVYDVGAAYGFASDVDICR